MAIGEQSIGTTRFTLVATSGTATISNVIINVQTWGKSYEKQLLKMMNGLLIHKNLLLLIGRTTISDTILMNHYNQIYVTWVWCG